MSASVNGKKLATLNFPSKRGWTTFAVDTGIAGGQRSSGEVSFKVWARKNHSRHFIFNGHFDSSRPHKALDPNDQSKESPSRRTRGQSKKQVSSNPDGEIVNKNLNDEQIKRGDHSESRRGRKEPLRIKTPTEPASVNQAEER